MINYLSIEQISKSFGDKFLFDDLSFGIAQGQKIALIGVNGSGKSTLLKIVAGLETPDSGQVSKRKGIRVAFLPQEPILPEHLTVGECVFSADLPELKLIEKYEKLLLADSNDEKNQEALSQVISEIDALEAWDYEVRIKQILGKLDVDFLDNYISELSGGQKKRVALAQALMGEPHLMIMDEPTNHLDLESIEWLEQFLSGSKQSLFLVTHDRYFLDSITNEIVELDQGKLYSYKGDYAYFLAKKAEREALKEQETDKAKSLYKTELEWLGRSPKARTTKSKSRIDAALALGDKSSYRAPDREVKLQVKGRRIGGKVLEIKNLRKSYGDLNILDNFTYTFGRKDRIGIIGPNGVGKTTFLRLLTGEEEPDSGKVRLGDTIVYGYYQQQGFSFKDNQRVIEVVTEAAEQVELSKSQTVSAAQLLEHFLFPRNMHSNMVETLSGGERRRLHLLRILMTNPNFLILDEPTNDLDLITLRRLEEFLQDFEGCLLVVTHDRFFMDRLVDHVFVFQGEGQIKDYHGSYSQYRKWESEQEAVALANSSKEIKAAKEKKASSPKERKLSFNEKREYEKLEAEIDKMEARKKEISELMNQGGSDFEALAKFSAELEEIDKSLDLKSERFFELMEIMEGN